MRVKIDKKIGILVSVLSLATVPLLTACNNNRLGTICGTKTPCQTAATLVNATQATMNVSIPYSTGWKNGFFRVYLTQNGRTLYEKDYFIEGTWDKVQNYVVNNNFDGRTFARGLEYKVTVAPGYGFPVDLPDASMSVWLPR